MKVRLDPPNLHNNVSNHTFSEGTWIPRAYGPHVRSPTLTMERQPVCCFGSWARPPRPLSNTPHRVLHIHSVCTPDPSIPALLKGVVLFSVRLGVHPSPGPSVDSLMVVMPGDVRPTRWAPKVKRASKPRRLPTETRKQKGPRNEILERVLERSLSAFGWGMVPTHEMQPLPSRMGLLWSSRSKSPGVGGSTCLAR